MSDFSSELQDHFEDPYHRGPCDECTHQAEASSEASGCVLRFEVHVEESGNLRELWFDGAGCKECEAVASMVCQASEGTTAGTLADLTMQQLASHLGFPEEILDRASCTPLPFLLLAECVSQAAASDDSDAAEQRFGGPSLREEC